MNRLGAVNNHFQGANTKVSAETITIDGKSYPEIIDHHPDRPIKMHYFNKQGWGYSDAGFKYNKQVKQIRIEGDRY